MDKIGKKFNGYAAGALEGLGMGRMMPFVKLGLDDMNGQWSPLDEEISAELEKFDSNFLDRASKLPPLGDFQRSADGVTPLTPDRLSELLRGFNAIIGKSGGPSNENGFDGLRKVFGAVNLLYTTFSDYKQFSKRAADSAFSNLRM